MKTAKLSDIIGIINKIAPPGLAESWDNSGLQVGDPAGDVHRIMVALEPTVEVIQAAVSRSCQLLVTHHPLIFKPVSSISTATVSGLSLHTAIKAGLAVVCLHTNYDTAPGGLNDLLAERIGVLRSSPLKAAFFQELVKLVVFVPDSHLEQLRTALFPYTVQLGAYQDCSFSTSGEGTFTPQQGAQPFVGSVNVREKVAEQRLELLIDRSMLSRAINRLVASHPYEEPAYDLYPLLNRGAAQGLGRIGELAEVTTVGSYAGVVAEKLGTPVRFVGNPAATVQKVAVCSGSGSSLMHDAIRLGADLLVTGDVKYHEAREAEARGLAVIDAGHFPTEIIMAAAVRERLQHALASGGYNADVVTCDEEYDPFKLMTLSK